MMNTLELEKDKKRDDSNIALLEIQSCKLKKY